jgi:hypothetical protein
MWFCGILLVQADQDARDAVEDARLAWIQLEGSLVSGHCIGVPVRFLVELCQGDKHLNRSETAEGRDRRAPNFVYLCVWLEPHRLEQVKDRLVDISQVLVAQANICEGRNLLRMGEIF